MKELRDEQELLFEMKKERIIFNQDIFYEFVEWEIEYIYRLMLDKEYSRVKKEIPEELFKKLSENKNRYRITDNMDHMEVQNARICDYFTENGEKYIQVRLSIIFYDRLDNKSLKGAEADNYWNDIWIVTYKKQESDSDSKNEFECEYCGAKMNFRTRKDVLECEYCNSKKFYKQNRDAWKIRDVEKMEESF